MTDKCLMIGKPCPKKSEGPGPYCPAWTEIMETNIQTGEDRITKDCIHRLMPRLMIEVIKASNRPAAQIGMMQQGVEKAFVNLARQAIRLPSAEAN